MVQYTAIKTSQGDDVAGHMDNNNKFVGAVQLAIPSVMGGTNEFHQIGPHMGLPISPHRSLADAFGRLRTSDPYALFNSKHVHDKSPMLWDEELYNSATSSHSSTLSMVQLSTSVMLQGAIRQTFQRFNYQPGKSQMIFMTFKATQQTNVRKRIGLFESSHVANSVPQNGIFLQVDGSDSSFNIAWNGSVSEQEYQGSWNIDTMDGSGPSETNPSGIELDWDAPQILIFDFEWLGVGTVLMGFVINRTIYYCHAFHHANDASNGGVYMVTPNLPLNYSIYQSAIGGGTLDCICASVISEGGTEPIGINHSINQGSAWTDASSTTQTYALLGIRLKQAYRDVTVVPSIASVVAGTSDRYLVTLVKNPTSISGTFEYNDKSNSACQVAISGEENIVTGGDVIYSGYGSAGADLQIPANAQPRIGWSIDGTPDELVMCVKPVTSNLDISGAFNWLEQP